MIKNARIVSKSANPNEYHAQAVERGNPKFAMSSSALREFANCPSRWLAGYQSPESEAKDWGSLLDCLALTPESFKARYSIRPVTYPADGKKGEQPTEKPWNGNSNWCKSWIEEQGGKPIVTAKELFEAENAVKRLMDDEIIRAFISDSDRQVWVTAEWHDEKTGLVVPLKCLIDLVPRNDTEFAKCFADMKTTRNAALMPWQRWCFTAGYYIQAAFYTALYCAAKPDEDRNTFCFILQENYAPWQPGKRILSQDFMALGHADFMRMLENYCQCLKSSKWPSYDDNDEAVQNWSVVSPEPWMAAHAEFAPKLEFAETEEAPQPTENNDVAS